MPLRLVVSPPPRVFVIDDDPDLLELLLDTLTEEGFPVTVASSLDEAQVLLSQDTFACILTDLFRPSQGDPFSAVESMRQLAPTTPLLIMTAWQLAPEDVAQHGYQGLLSKPFELEAVVALVQTGLTDQPVARSLLPPREEQRRRPMLRQEERQDDHPQGDADEGTSWPLSPLLKVLAAYQLFDHQMCWQPTWVNGLELAAGEQEAGLYAFVSARRAEGWALLLTTQGATAAGIPTLRLTFSHPTTEPRR